MRYSWTGPALLAVIGAVLVIAGVTVVLARKGDLVAACTAAGLIALGTRLIVASAFFSRVSSGQVGALGWKLKIARRPRRRRRGKHRS
jgi:hypothetical protein